MPTLDELREQAYDLTHDKDTLKSELAEVAAQHNDINIQIAKQEQIEADEAALAELRERGGVDGAVAARTIAATLPDADRAAAFAALADELLG